MTRLLVAFAAGLLAGAVGLWLAAELAGRQPRAVRFTPEMRGRAWGGGETVIDKNLPTLASLRGIAPGATGDLSSEEFVRSLREDWK